VQGEEARDQPSGELLADRLVEDHPLEQQRTHEPRHRLVQVHLAQLPVADGPAQDRSQGLPLPCDELGVERRQLGIVGGAGQQRRHQRRVLLGGDLLGERAQQRLQLLGQVP
jgi:hypothetical protein